MMRPHEPWCDRPLATHAECRAMLADVEVAAGLRVVVSLSKVYGVPALVSVWIDRGKAAGTLLPLTAKAAAPLGEALTKAVQLASHQ